MATDTKASKYLRKRGPAIDHDLASQPACGNCGAFVHEDTSGHGWCTMWTAEKDCWDKCKRHYTAEQARTQNSKT